MTPAPNPPLILVCDHRGEGLTEAVGGLGAMGYRLETTSCLAHTRERVRALTPSLVLVDPLSRGGAVELAQVDEARAGAATAVLVVAEPADPLPALAAARALRAGPWDLVHRGAPLEEFHMRIERLRARVEELAELDEIRYHADHDDRTGLLRPRPFQERLREHFSAAQRHRFDLALVLLDLDDFGRVNKQFDHTVGDQLITRVGSVVRRSLRAEDVGGRLGGDEFAIVLPYTRKVDAARVVNRLRDEIGALAGPVDPARGELATTASLGFDTFDGSDLESVEELRRHAEIALRQAKALGGNRALYYRSLSSEPSGSAYQDRA